MKIYVLTLSKVFPTTHKRKGEPTNFAHKVEAAINKWNDHELKNHTIRANYELWKKRFEEIDAGRACLSIRQWTGKPYASKQVEIVRLTHEDGIGIQMLRFETLWGNERCLIGYTGYEVSFENIANNDGLSYDDWQDWFKDYDLSKPLAIIHFTKFRY